MAIFVADYPKTSYGCKLPENLTWPNDLGDTTRNFFRSALFHFLNSVLTELAYHYKCSSRVIKMGSICILAMMKYCQSKLVTKKADFTRMHCVGNRFKSKLMFVEEKA